jgi:hypothetical protein
LPNAITNYIYDHLAKQLSNLRPLTKASTPTFGHGIPSDHWTDAVLGAHHFVEFRELSTNPTLLYERLLKADDTYLTKFGDAIAARLDCSSIEGIGMKSKTVVMAACEAYIKQYIHSRITKVSDTNTAIPLGHESQTMAPNSNPFLAAADASNPGPW